MGESDRKRILDATAQVFLEKGFARANTSEIARRARTSKQTLYALFSTKADLFAGVVAAHTEELFARHPYYIESGKPPRRALIEIGQMTLDLFANPEFLALYRIVVAEAHNFPHLALKLWLEFTDRGYGMLAEYMRSRRIGAPNHRRAAERFLSLVIGDFLLNAMLNPGLSWSGRSRAVRVRQAVDDFLAIYPPSDSAPIDPEEGSR